MSELTEEERKIWAYGVGPNSLSDGTDQGIIEGQELIEHYKKALRAIARLEGMTLLAYSAGQDGDHWHQVGANKAFNQAAEIAKEALNE